MMNPHTRISLATWTVNLRVACETTVRDIRITMMIPLVLTQLAMEEEILLTPMATLVLRTTKTGMELEAPDSKENR